MEFTAFLYKITSQISVPEEIFFIGFTLPAGSFYLVLILSIWQCCCSQLASAPEISTDDASGSRQVDLLDDQVQSSESNSPDSGTATELPSADKREPSSPQTLDTYAEIGLVRDRSPKYAPSQNQDPTELPGFSVSLH